MYDYQFFNRIKRLAETLAEEGQRECETRIVAAEIDDFPIYWDLDKNTLYPRPPKWEMH